MPDAPHSAAGSRVGQPGCAELVEQLKRIGGSLGLVVTDVTVAVATDVGVCPVAAVEQRGAASPLTCGFGCGNLRVICC